jgi:hypothetical protein
MIKVRNNKDNEFTLAPWDLAMVGLPGNTTERLSLHNSYVHSQEVDQFRQNFVNNYKEKKLSI